jgi:hypothetical protein
MSTLVRCRRRSNSRLAASPFLASRMIPVLRAVDAFVRRLGSLPITTAKVSASDSPSRIAMKAEHSEPCHIPVNVLNIQRSMYYSARQLRCGFFCEAMIQAVNAFACQGRPEAGQPPPFLRSGHLRFLILSLEDRVDSSGHLRDIMISNIKAWEAGLWQNVRRTRICLNLFQKWNIMY